MPGYLAAPININNRGAIMRTFFCEGSFYAINTTQLNFNLRVSTELFALRLYCD
jgi:hypothetical protein